MDLNKIKKIGPFLRFVYNFFLAGRTIVIKGRPITLPKLNESQVVSVAAVKLENLV